MAEPFVPVNDIVSGDINIMSNGIKLIISIVRQAVKLC